MCIQYQFTYCDGTFNKIERIRIILRSELKSNSISISRPTFYLTADT